MKNTIRLEELGMFLLALSLAYFWDLNVVMFLLCFFLPDIGIAGYLAGPKVGSFTYNILHHKGIAAILVILGLFTQVDMLLFLGLILFAHSSFDRVFGFGLKYRDSFHNTHLGKIGAEIG
jgi:hypothetical protein